jgi:polysaccharide export outer membrane protein
MNRAESADIELIALMNTSFNRFAGIALALGAWLLAGASLAAEKPSAPAAVSPAATPAPAVPGVTPLPSVDASYIIGPGDVLQVFVWRQPELSVSVPVRPDGKVSTPLVEDLVAVGKTSSELAREIERVLSEYVRSPQVNVIVSQPISTFSQVRIIGQVAKPQALPYREGITALDAVLAVGGLAPFAAGNRAKIVRAENGKQREIKIKLDDLVNKGDMSQNLALKPGDVLVIPESRF